MALDGERLGLVELIERAGEIGGRHGVGIVDHIEDRIVGLKVRDLYEVPAAAIILTAHKELEKLVGTIHQNNFKPQLDRHWAYLVYAGLWYEPLLGDLNAFMDVGQRAGHRRDHDAALQGQRRARSHARVAQRALRPGAGRLRRVRRPLLASRRARASSSSGRCSRGWRTTCATGERRTHDHRGYTVLGWLVWQVLRAWCAQDRAEQGEDRRGGHGRSRVLAARASVAAQAPRPATS